MKTSGSILLLLTVCLSLSTRADWTARPLEVHEWGVSEYDWSQSRGISSAFPDFFYTDRSPGKALGRPKKERVKDMEADSGIRIRTKPLICFYGPDLLKGGTQREVIPVGVETRFVGGHAISWWPQASVYRTATQANQAEAPDLEEWNRKRVANFRSRMKARLKPEEFQKAWSYYEGRQFMPNQLGFNLEEFGGMQPFPDDERFQLVWDRLSLTQKLADGARLEGENLPETNWVSIARQVDSDYVSNGTEAEKFLFYEGKTPEMPAIALVPYEQWLSNDPSLLVENLSSHPIYDVFIIYRNETKGQFWARYVPKLTPLAKEERDPAGEQGRPYQVHPMIPNFEKAQRSEFIDEEEFHRRTQLQLGRLLSMNHSLPDEIYNGRRNPAQYQPPTTEFRLFPKEVAALERIWNRQFFGNSGLTVLYRESTEYLDQAVPLHVYTDMRHYVKLSRCSLVVNRSVDPRRIAAIGKELQAAFSETGQKKLSPEKLKQTALNCFTKDRFGTLGLLESWRIRGWWGDLTPPILNELKARMN